MAVVAPRLGDAPAMRRAPRVRGLLLAVLASLGVCGGVLWSSGTALAAAPEEPLVTVESPTAFTATFHGVMNPIEAKEPNELGGTYKFLYKASKTECTGGTVMKPSALWFGGLQEGVSKAVTGLTPNTEYSVCLSATNLEGETTVSAPVQFATHVAPEKPETKAATGETATSAVLEGTLNPLGGATTKAGWYFAYDEGSSCTGAGEQRTALEPEVEGKALGEKTEVTNLQPDREYRVCLVATDEVGDAVVGNEVLVKTLAPPPAILSESAPALVVPAPVTGFLEATLSATVNPNNQVTECHFQYGVASVSENETACEQGSLTGLEQSVSLKVTGLQLERVYHYRVVLKNAKAEEAKGAEEKLETLFSPSGLQTSAAEEVTAQGASLGGKLDAGGEAEYYVEYGTAACLASSCGTKSPATHVSGRVQECTLGGVLQQCVTPVAVSGLEPSTTYHYWLVATNAAVVKPVHGAAAEFTTKVAAPAPQTGEATEVTATSARLTGELNPGGGETEYYFEYQNGFAAGKSAPAFANGKTLASVAPAVVSGLEPNTTYYYSLNAKNSAVSEPVRGGGFHHFTTAQSAAEVEAQEAANRKPAEELAAANAARQKGEEEAASKRAQEAAAAANAPNRNQYAEIAAQTAELERQVARANDQSAKGTKAKPSRATCRKGFIKKKRRCVSKKSKKKTKAKK